MRTDNALTHLWVTPKFDGNIGLRTGGAQKFPKVEFTHLSERLVIRSLSIVSDNCERDHLLSGGVLEKGQ